MILYLHSYFGQDGFSILGVYRAPCDGTYEFTVHIQTFEETYYQLSVEGVAYYIDNYFAEHYTSGTVMVELTAGNDVDVYTGIDSSEIRGSPYYLSSYFSGKRVF